MSILTFLFTDIEGSTRRWEADADAMRSALEAHNTVLRDAVAAHGGTICHFPVHRHRGFDAALGSRPRRNADGTRGPQSRIARSRRSPRRQGVRLHRRWHVRRIRLSPFGCRCRTRHADIATYAFQQIDRVRAQQPPADDR
jgi:class 3 adenylate cyclase